MVDESIQTSFKSDYFERITKIGNVESLELSVYEIEHNSDSDPRVSLSRNAFRLMSQHGAKKALVIFFNSDSPNYRLSLITIDLKWEEGKRVRKEYSNPRRYSFYLGPDAKTHTPEKYLVKQGRVQDFDDLTSRFSIEVVNKEFYTSVADLYTELVGGTRGEGKKRREYTGSLKLPSISAQSEILQRFAVRLIGRIMFCWFLREKKSDRGLALVPCELLSADTAYGASAYYHKILEPLFFEVLNKPLDERKKDFCGDVLDTVPYLNGGLFDIHLDDFYSSDDRKQAINHSIVDVPDEWLRRLFDLLETYNFTVDENTSIDIDLSIDPEMLGRIFENLLAEINPETGKTARKSTGSYYTPRHIVEYMVDQSLLLYLEHKTGIGREKIRSLLRYDLEDDQAHIFTRIEQKEIVEAISNLTVLDPACGSGAFPIGVLQKIVFMLRLIDPDATLWVERQLKSASPELRRLIEHEFEHRNLDYIRKLAVIRQSIYGVDIQPIATEIARLRCFLTLIVDERVNDKEPNRGIEPLPNLDFKFVTANSLIGLTNSDESVQPGLFGHDLKISELKLIRDEYFGSESSERETLIKQFQAKRREIYDAILAVAKEDYVTDEVAQKLSNWNPFGHERTDWLDPEWMFGISGGFDIVIGNPPYGADLSMSDITFLLKHYEYFDRQKNSAAFFIELACGLVKKKGLITFIVPKSLSFSEGWERTRRFISEQNQLQAIVDVSKAFESVLLEQVIVTFINDRAPEYDFQTATAWQKDIQSVGNVKNILISELSILPIYVSERKQKILDLISRDTIQLGKITETFRGFPFQKLIGSEGVRVLRGRNIGRFSIQGDIAKAKIPLKKLQDKKAIQLRKQKIISQNVVAHRLKPYDQLHIVAAIDNQKLVTLDTVMNTFVKSEQFCIEYLAALLNSKLAAWYYYWFVFNRAVRTMHFDKYYVGKLPVKKIDMKQQENIKELVAIVSSYSSEERQSKELECASILKKIDDLIFNAYGIKEGDIDDARLD